MHKVFLCTFFIFLSCFITSCNADDTSNTSNLQETLEFDLSPTTKNNIDNIPPEMSTTNLEESQASTSLSLDTILGNPNTYDATPNLNSVDSDLENLLRNSLNESTESTEPEQDTTDISTEETTEPEQINETSINSTSTNETIAIPKTGLFADDYIN